MPTRSSGAAWLAALSLVPTVACRNTEDVRVRDDGRILYSGHARWSPPHLKDREKGFGVGVEAAALYTDGDYTSPAGQLDFSYSLGYVAAVLETKIRDFRILPKLGVGYGNFEVEGQMRTLREDGFGGVLGLEGRYAATDRLDLFARGSFFRRSSLYSLAAAAGVSWSPIEHVGIEIGYGLTSNQIEESFDVLGAGDEADVQTHGPMIGMVLQL
jgi:hypothetical protein